MISRAECRRIVEQVARERGLRCEDVLGHYRTKDLVAARRAIALRLNERGVSHLEIGRIIQRHATSVADLIRGRRQHGKGGRDVGQLSEHRWAEMAPGPLPDRCHEA